MLSDLARFVPYLAGKRAALAAVFALGLGGAAVSLSLPLLGKAFVDAVASRGDFAIVPAIAGAMLALALLDFALATASQRLHARLSADVLARLRAALFERCAEGPLEAAERFRHGDLLTRFGTDVPRVQVLLVDGLLGGLQNLLFLLVAAVVTIGLSPPLAGWSFAGLLLALAATAAFRRPVETRSARVREAMADLAHFFSERLAALRALRFHRTARDERRRLDDASERLGREVVALQQQDALASGVPGLLLAAALAWIYVVGGRLLEDGAITLGTFIAFVLYQARLFSPASALLGLARNLQQARVSIERVNEVLAAGDDAPRPLAATITADNAPPPAAATIPGHDAIVVADLAFAYPGKPPLFANLELRVRRGERVALFGASGAGKSTLVQLLFGLRRPAAGTIRMVDALAGGRAGGGHALGYACAEPFLLHASVEENLRYIDPDACRAEIVRAAALAEADAFIRALPEGYATVIGGRGLALSDGQRQRLGLARLFLLRPAIAILDEAFSGLDLETEARIRRNLWQALAGSTFIVVSHRPTGLDEFDRLLFLHDGCLTAVTPDELRALLAIERDWSKRTTIAAAP